MTVVTTRPNATVSSSGYANTGGGSRHGATSDDSDATYITGAYGDLMVLGFAEPSIPAGGLVKSLAFRARTARGGVLSIPATLNATLYAAGISGTRVSAGTAGVSWVTPNTITIGAGAWSATPTDVAVLLTEAAGSPCIIYEAYVDTTYVAKPVTTPSAPTGTVTATNVPTVTWGLTIDADGGPQTHYQVRVFTAAQYGAGGFNAASSTATWDSGDVVSASESAQVTTPLADATYRAYVRVGQTVNGITHWSDYAYTGFVIDVDLPAVPDITVASDTGSLNVYVEENSGAATTDWIEVQRSTDAGATWETCRAVLDGGLLEAPFGTIYDSEAPNGTLMSYRARALHEISAGNFVASAWTSTTTGTWTSTDWWLKCPQSPALNMVVTPFSVPGHQRPSRQGVFQPLGREDIIIVADVRGAPRGTLKLQIDTQAEQDDLDALLDSNLTLLLQGPPEHHWPDRYIRFGDQDRARWIDKAWVGEHIDTLQWWEVAPPDGLIDAWPA